MGAYRQTNGQQSGNGSTCSSLRIEIREYISIIVTSINWNVNNTSTAIKQSDKATWAHTDNS